MDVTEYQLYGEHEVARLQTQAKAWREDSEYLLDQIGVPAGSACLDFGCGAIGILESLVQRVGSDGRVVGLDPDATLLEAASTHLIRQGVRNVELIRGDGATSALSPGSFDLVHERLVFWFLRKPKEALQQMVHLARPGGVIVLQEPDLSSWGFHPRTAQWNRLLEIMRSAAAVHGDPEIGGKTLGMMRRAGLEQTGMRASVLALSDGHPLHADACHRGGRHARAYSRLAAIYRGGA